MFQRWPSMHITWKSMAIDVPEIIIDVHRFFRDYFQRWPSIFQRFWTLYADFFLIWFSRNSCKSFPDSYPAIFSWDFWRFYVIFKVLLKNFSLCKSLKIIRTLLHMEIAEVVYRLISSWELASSSHSHRS